jgi:hypothetical protein
MAWMTTAVRRQRVTKTQHRCNCHAVVIRLIPSHVVPVGWLYICVGRKRSRVRFGSGFDSGICEDLWSASCTQYLRSRKILYQVEGREGFFQKICGRPERHKSGIFEDPILEASSRETLTANVIME